MLLGTDSSISVPAVARLNTLSFAPILSVRSRIPDKPQCPARADCEIEVELEYAVDQLRLLVRDNGCGIAGDVLQSARAGHWGLSGMRERTERIGAKLRVLSRATAGTEIELSVPSNIAYLLRDSDRPVKWFSKLRPPEVNADDSPIESERVR